MKIVAILGMLHTGSYCILQSVGEVPQSLFADNLIWIWGIIGCLWILSAGMLAGLYEITLK